MKITFIDLNYTIHVYLQVWKISTRPKKELSKDIKIKRRLRNENDEISQWLFGTILICYKKFPIQIFYPTAYKTRRITYLRTKCAKCHVVNIF